MLARVLLVALVLFAGATHAKNLYVNNSGTPACSDATTYANNDASNPWCTLGRAVWGNASRTSPNASEAATAGDTVTVTAGTYSAPGTNSRSTSAFNPVNTGTSGSQLVIQASGTVYLTLSSDRGPVIGADNLSGSGNGYITWRGFTINEADAPHAPDTGNAVIWYSSGNVIENMTFNGVGQTATDPPQCNHSAIRIEGSTAASNTIRNNIITNYKSDGCGEWNVNGSGLILYYADGTVIENNTISVAGTGLYIKGGAHSNTTIRKNLFYSTQTAIAFQYSATSGSVNLIYQNVVRCTSNVAPESHGIAFGADNHSTRVVNNTIVDCVNSGISYGNYTPYVTDPLIQNNIVYQSTGYTWGGAGETSLDAVVADYNVYYSRQQFDVVGSYSSLAAWRTALGGCPGTGNECGSSTEDPLFVAYASQNYRLQESSPARTVGVDILDLDGDSSTSDTIPAGAYITGSETIGAGTSLLPGPGRPRWRPASWWDAFMFAGTLH